MKIVARTPNLLSSQDELTQIMHGEISHSKFKSRWLFIGVA